MTSYIIYNGEFQESDKPILHIHNRAFRYGDGLFESIRIVNGKLYNFEGHYDRLISGMKAFAINTPSNYTKDYFYNQLDSLIQRNGIHEGGIAKLTVYRKGEISAYFSETNEPGFLLEAKSYANNLFTLNAEGIDIDLYNEVAKPLNNYSIFKSTNAFFYVQASMKAHQRGLKDILLVNEKGGIIESTNSNLFIASNGVLYTPPLADGCVGGTMRMKVINLAIKNGVKVYECSISPQHLLSCDEIILTNAIQGIKWVSSYRSKRFFHKISDKLISYLNEDMRVIKGQV